MRRPCTSYFTLSASTDKLWVQFPVLIILPEKVSMKKLVWEHKKREFENQNEIKDDPGIIHQTHPPLFCSRRCFSQDPCQGQALSVYTSIPKLLYKTSRQDIFVATNNLCPAVQMCLLVVNTVKKSLSTFLALRTSGKYFLENIFEILSFSSLHRFSCQKGHFFLSPNN